MRIITVSREFGSGGRELGKRLADALGIAYYDKEIITAIADEMSLNEDYVEKMIEKGVASQMYPITFSRTFSYPPHLANDTPALLAKQRQVIRALAEKGDCVIVGRSADVLLEEYRPMKLFVYADMPSKIMRCRQRASADEKLTDKEYEKEIKKIDKGRQRSHDLVSPYLWGDKSGYHLCMNTSGMEIKKMVPVAAEYAEMWFEADRRDK